MKKLIIFSAVVLVLFACKKEQVEPENTQITQPQDTTPSILSYLVGSSWTLEYTKTYNRYLDGSIKIDSITVTDTTKFTYLNNQYENHGSVIENIDTATVERLRISLNDSIFFMTKNRLTKSGTDIDTVSNNFAFKIKDTISADKYLFKMYWVPSIDKDSLVDVDVEVTFTKF